jgi:hypothetical protein
MVEDGFPSPKTVWVPLFQRGQFLQSAAARLIADRLLLSRTELGITAESQLGPHPCQSRAIATFRQQATRRLGAIADFFRTSLARAVGAAIYGRVDFHTVSDDATSTMRACGRKSLDGTLKGIKGVRLAPDQDLKGLVVVVSTCFANGHKSSSV